MSSMDKTAARCRKESCQLKRVECLRAHARLQPTAAPPKDPGGRSPSRSAADLHPYIGRCNSRLRPPHRRQKFDIPETYPDRTRTAPFVLGVSLKYGAKTAPNPPRPQENRILTAGTVREFYWQ